MSTSIVAITAPPGTSSIAEGFYRGVADGSRGSTRGSTIGREADARIAAVIIAIVEVGGIRAALTGIDFFRGDTERAYKEEMFARSLLLSRQETLPLNH